MSDWIKRRAWQPGRLALAHCWMAPPHRTFGTQDAGTAWRAQLLTARLTGHTRLKGTLLALHNNIPKFPDIARSYTDSNPCTSTKG